MDILVVCTLLIESPAELLLQSGESYGESGWTHQDGPLQVRVDAAEHELPHDGGNGGEDQGAAQDPCG